MKNLMPTLLILATAWTATAQEVVEVGPASVNRPGEIFAKIEAKAVLWNELTAERVAGAESGEITVRLSEDEKMLLACPECFHDEKVQPEIVGLHLPVDLPVRFGDHRSLGLDKSGGVEVGRQVTKAGGEFVWTSSIRAEGANGIRIRFTNVDLPVGAALYIYSDAGEAHGPYTGHGPHDSGEFWSHSVLGQDVWVQLHIDDEGTRDKVAFDIHQISYLGDAFENERLITWDEPSKADCSANVSCVENAECWSSLDDTLDGARRAVARLLIETDAGTGWCTGSLLNDIDSSGHIPWMLTANHCIDNEAEADSVEAKFQYQSSCGSCSGSSIDTVLGADHWASDRNGDFSLIELSESPSNAYFLGWSSTQVLDDDGEQLYRISHPQGKPQSFSQHEVHDKTNTNFVYNTDYYIYSKNVIGTTEGGSSGSPILRDDGRVVGQLRGKVGIGQAAIEEDPEIQCDPTEFHTQDGALSTYVESVRPYLYNSPSHSYAMHVGDITPVVQSFSLVPGWNIYVGMATIEIVDELGAGIPRATVLVDFTGDMSGPTLTITNSHGVAMVATSATYAPTEPSFSVCVSDVTHDYFDTYDSASNVETCDSH